MATTTATGAGTTQNNGTTVLGGNPGNTAQIYDLTLTTNAVEAFGTGPVISDDLGNQAAISGREFGKVRAGQYSILTVSDKVAGVADTTLKNTARHNILNSPKLETVKTGFLRALSWTSLNVDLPTYTATNSAQTVSMGEDKAITAPRLTYIAAGNSSSPSYKAY